MRGKAKIKPIIFLAFANARDDTVGYLRNLPDEARRVLDVLNSAEQAGLCAVEVRSNCTAADIFKVFQDPRFRNRITIFHFGGHANGYKLLLESADGEPAAADAGGFATFLAEQEGLQLVFLNGCSTQQQSQGLLDANVSAVISTSQLIDDSVATDFACHFYQGLAGGATLRTAYNEAAGAVRTAKGGDTRALYLSSEINQKKQYELGIAGTDVEASPPRFTVPWQFSTRDDSQSSSAWTLSHALKTMAIQLWYDTPCRLRERSVGPDQLRTSDVPSPLMQYWRAYLRRPPWIDTIRELIDRAPKSADNAYKDDNAQENKGWENELAALGAINFERDYESVWLDLKVTARRIESAAQRQLDILHSAINHARNKKEDTKTFEDQLPEAFGIRDMARELLSQPSFGRCFLVAGGYGTGKSHFIAAALESAMQNELIYITLDVDADHTGNFDEWLLRSVAIRTGVEFESLGDLHHYLEACGIRLVCIVDDLHRSFFLPNATFFQRLMKWIRRRTHFSSLLWLITTQDNLFDEIFRDEVFWQLHGCNSKDCLAGWYLLERLNRTESIGLQIVLEWIDRGESKSRFEVDESFQKYMQSPMIAWLYLDYVAEKNGASLGSLNKTSFVNRQWKRVLANRPPSKVDDRQLRGACKQVANEIVRSHDLFPLLAKVLKGKNASTNWTNTSFGILESLGLIRRFNLTDDVYKPHERIELRFENLWFRWIAMQLKRHLKRHVKEQPTRSQAARQHVVQWFGEIHNEYAREGIWESLLLTITEDEEPQHLRRKTLIDSIQSSDKYKDQSPQLSADSWEWAFYDGPLPLAAVFFGAANSTLRRRQALLDTFTRKRMSLTPRESFALLYFLGACDDLSPSKRLRAMRGHHRVLGKTNLATYFCYVVDTILSTVNNNNEMINCMYELSGSFRLNCAEVELVSKRVAVSVLDRLIKINNNDAEPLVRTVVNYLHGEQGQGLGHDRFIEKYPRNMPWLFHEWVEQMLCESLISRIGPRQAFQLLYRNDWYQLDFNKRVRQSYLSRIVMRSKQKQANLAFGRWYRETQHSLQQTDSRLREYTELCSALFGRQLEGEELPLYTKELAFFMIRHSVPRPVRDDENAILSEQPVAYSFRPLVEAMRIDPDTKRFFDDPRTAFVVEGDEVSNEGKFV